MTRDPSARHRDVPKLGELAEEGLRMIRRFRLSPADDHGRGRQKTPLNATSLESHATFYSLYQVQTFERADEMAEEAVVGT